MVTKTSSIFFTTEHIWSHTNYNCCSNGHGMNISYVSSFRSIDAKHQLPIFAIDAFRPTPQNSTVAI